MERRRFLIVLATVLAAAATAAALAPTQEDPASDDQATGLVADPAPGSASGADRPLELRFAVTARERTVERVRLGRQVIVTVGARNPGQVELRGLGRLMPVTPEAPAVFDLLPTRPGRFEVVYRPVDGETLVVGAVIVEPPGSARSDRRGR